MIRTIFSAEYGDRNALISDSGEIITYSELTHIVGDVSKHLERNSLALLVMNNDVGAVAFYLACLLVGTVVIIVDKDIAELEMNNYIQQYEPDYIIISKSKSTFVDVNYEPSLMLYRHILYKNVEVATKSIHSDLAILLPTSGTTHISKLVRISKENIYDNAKNICKELEITHNDVAITSLPLSYTYGLSVLNTHLLKHATVLLTDKSVLQKSFWEFLNKYKATSFAGVPYTYELLEKSGYLLKESSLKIYTQAGGRLSLRLQQKFTEYCCKKGKRFYVMYGQTEATARISILHMKYASDKLGSVGKAICGGVVYIENQNASTNEGEIVYTGKNVCMGYCTCLNDLALGDENKGILHTGDYGYLDEDGFIYITGRREDFIKKYGRRICLSSISRMLDEEYDVKVVCSYEEPTIIVEYEKENEMKIKKIKETLHRSLHLSQSDISFRMIDKFKRTSNGKICRGGEYGKNI